MFFQTNHLAHFYLFHKMLPALRRCYSSRVIIVSCESHRYTHSRYYICSVCYFHIFYYFRPYPISFFFAYLSLLLLCCRQTSVASESKMNERTLSPDAAHYWPLQHANNTKFLNLLFSLELHAR